MDKVRENEIYAALYKVLNGCKTQEEKAYVSDRLLTYLAMQCKSEIEVETLICSFGFGISPPEYKA
jgi:hypothetical protein